MQEPSAVPDGEAKAIRLRYRAGETGEKAADRARIDRPARFRAFTVTLGFALLALSAHAATRVVGLRCEDGVEPWGIDTPAPFLSWRIQSGERGARQIAWQVLVASTDTALAQDRGDLWDSGRQAGSSSIGIRYEGRPLSSSQQVHWKVRVWDAGDRPSAWSEPASWTMGLMQSSDWRGVWIAAPGDTESLLLRHDFAVRPGLRRAIVHVSGLGQYALFCNGARVGKDFLSPGWTNYRVAALYDTHDVTSLLRTGENAFGLFLGNGFDHVARRDRFTKLTTDFGPLRAILHLRLEYADGTVEFVGTDAGWRSHPGPITTGNIYAGEDYDAGQMPGHWAEPGFDDRAWPHAVQLLRSEVARRGFTAAADPLREIEVHDPVGRKDFSDGTVVYDLGQNAAHIPRLRVSGPVGSIVRITPAEVVNADGTINRNTMDGGNRGNAWWQYTKATDGPETWEPFFYYVGCRYLKVECFRDQSELPLTVPAEDSTHRSVIGAQPRPGDPSRLPRVDSLQGIVVHSAAPAVGEFACSNPLLNRIHALVRWAQRSNMVSVLTDCPHREKLGWLEQYHLNGPSLRYEFDADRIFRKGMRDVADDQAANGMVPNIAPEFTQFAGPFRSAAEWGAAFILVPWQQYQFTGDLDLARTYFDAMKRYFAYLESLAPGDVLTQGLGDWYDLGPQPSKGPAQLTPPPETASAFYFYDAAILSRLAARLGRDADAAAFATRAAQIRARYNQRFYHADRGSYGTGSQCANALPLVLGLVPDGEAPRVLAALVRDVEAHGYEMTTGDIGFRFLLRALADGGRSDVIYRMINRDDKPGYGYQLKQGATALAETWDASLRASHDHFMLGQIIEWFYHDLVGIAADPEDPGFAHVLVRPQPVGDLTWAEGRYDSVRGPIFVRWERSHGEFTLRVAIPANTTATVYLPARTAAVRNEAGGAVTVGAGIRVVRREADRTVLDVDAGEYLFRSDW